MSHATKSLRRKKLKDVKTRLKGVIMICEGKYQAKLKKEREHAHTILASYTHENNSFNIYCIPSFIYFCC
jgi:hypothetical protein